MGRVREWGLAVTEGVRSANPPLPTRSSQRTKPPAGTPTHASSLTYAAEAVRQVASYAPRLLLQILPEPRAEAKNPASNGAGKRCRDATVGC